MVKKVLDIVYKEVRGLHQAAYVLALFAFASQLLALLRDRLLAHQFGAGAELDIYYAAFRIPDLLFVLFASSLSVYVLIPFVSKAREKGGDKAGGKLLSEVFSVFLVVYTLFAAICFFLAPTFLPKLFPGIEDVESLVILTRILLLQPFLLGISSLFGVVTQLAHRFVVYALSPLLYNIGIIVGILFLYPVYGISGLGFGVVFGAFLHLLVQIPLVYRGDLKISTTLSFDFKGLISIFALSIPRALTLSMQQIVLLIIVGFASVMTVGSVAIFQFAYNLQSVPLAIIGVSYSVAAFPILAELYSKSEHEKFAAHINTALRHIIFWSIPAIALIIVLRAQLVRVVLGSGAFDWADTRLTAAALALLSLSLLAQAIYLVVIRAFYAGGKTMLPLIVTLISSVVSVGAAYGSLQIYLSNQSVQDFVVSFLRLEGIGSGSEVLALAFGYSISLIIQAVIITFCMSKVFSIKLRPILRPLIHSFCAATVGGLAAYATLNFVVEGIDQERFVGILIQGAIAGVVGVAGIIVTYAYFRSPELNEIYSSFHKKILKTDVVAPQEEVM